MPRKRGQRSTEAQARRVQLGVDRRLGVASRGAAGSTAPPEVAGVAGSPAPRRKERSSSPTVSTVVGSRARAGSVEDPVKEEKLEEEDSEDSLLLSPAETVKEDQEQEKDEKERKTDKRARKDEGSIITSLLTSISEQDGRGEV